MRVAGCYVHDADCATFKRRAYHLLDYNTGKMAVRPRMAGVKKIDWGVEEDEGDQDNKKNGDNDDNKGGSKRGGGGGVNVPLTNKKCFEKHIILIVLGRSTPKFLL